MATGPQVTNRGINKIQPGNISANDSSPQIPLGTISIDGNNVYKYVKFLGDNALVPGDACCYATATQGGLDANYQTVGGFNSALGAGICCGTVPASVVSYGWIQVKGQAQLAGTGSITNGIVAGNTISMTGAPSKGLKVISLVTDMHVGTVLVAATPTVVCDFPWL